VVQISLSGNFISETVNMLDADVTGDGLSDIVFTSIKYVGGPNAASASALPYGKARGFVNGAFYSAIATAGDAGDFDARFVTSTSSPTFATADDLFPITFTDPSYGGAVTAWLDVRSVAQSPSTSPSAPSASVTLQRVIFDDENLGTRPIASATAPDYPEATPIPEPSSLGLLALGAAGVLARRRRKRES
jgi:hypothetical protein